MTVKTIKFKKFDYLNPEQEREVKGMIIALALFAAGMIIGSGLFRSASNGLNDFLSVFDEYIAIRSSAKMHLIFFNSFCMNAICMVVGFFAGLSCFGIPVTIILIALKGLGVGILAGFLFSEYSMSGIGYYLLTILPGGIIANSALLLACNNACFSSIDILATVLSKKHADENLIKDYIKKCLIMLIITVIASMIDSVLIKAFSHLFIF